MNSRSATALSPPIRALESCLALLLLSSGAGAQGYGYGHGYQEKY
jgi:hypothetical protein